MREPLHGQNQCGDFAQTTGDSPRRHLGRIHDSDQERTADTTAIIRASFGALSTAQTNLVIRYTAPLALSSLTITPNPVNGGTAATGTVKLNRAAPAGGTTVLIASSHTNYATVPASVTVPQGATTVTFTVDTVAVASNKTPQISAELGDVIKILNLAIRAPKVISMSLNPTTIKAHQTSTATITLDSVAQREGTSLPSRPGAPPSPQRRRR